MWPSLLKAFSDFLDYKTLQSFRPVLTKIITAAAVGKLLLVGGCACAALYSWESDR